MFLSQIVILLSPFVPFISEEIYSALPNSLNSINLESWPKNLIEFDENVDNQMSSIIEVITLVRNLRNTENIANSIKLPIMVYDKSEDEHLISNFNSNIEYLIKFTNASTFETKNHKNFTENGRVLPITGGEMFVSLENAIDIDKEISKLKAELVKVQNGIIRGENLFNSEFVNKAPKLMVDKERKILDDYLEKKKSIEKRIDELENKKK